MILVTGANGFLGRNLIDELHGRRYCIRAFVGPGNMGFNPDGKVAEILRGDILDGSAVQQATEGCDTVIHTAAVTTIWPRRNEIQRKINIDGTANVLEAARKVKVKRMIYVGSATSFGCGSKEDPGDETREYSLGSYGLDYFDSKYEAQKSVLQAARAGDVPAVVVNPTYMFGPYDSKPGSGTLILGIYHRKLPGGSTGGRNYASVKDVAVGIANALEKGNEGDCYILGNENLSYGELYAKISAVTGKPTARRTWPAWLGKTVGLAGSAYGRVFHVMPALTYVLVKLALSEHYYTARRAVEALEMPQTPIETAIDQALGWFRDNGYLDLKFLKEKVQKRGSM